MMLGCDMKQLPKHLRKYIVEQNYEKYTPVDQACWRFILRQLKNFLSKHAHDCYVDGLNKTGIDTEIIPKIEDISKKLEKFGWRALPVSGFIPPAAFMELQSLSVLPIASDMRSLDHLMYTPAPDIVHEAAGHAPILVHPEFADYLRQYAQVAVKAIISKEDLDLYEAIRVLSDIKENPNSTEEEVEAAQKNLDTFGKSISHVSEASELSRMNWWTAEYGLIGDIKNPKIFGAGLLSSVGESRWCLSAEVKKIPLTVDCIKQTYDITEPQPQLFVTPDFKTLSKVLDQMANKMAFRVGGLDGLHKAIRAATVNTAELNSGIQISGKIVEALVGDDTKTPIYVRLEGPCQLSYNDQELAGHDNGYHGQGFGTAVGFFKKSPDKCPSLYSEDELKSLDISAGSNVAIEFTSGVRVEGKLINTLRRDGKLILMSFENCKVTYFGRVLFEPSWGVYDLAIGSRVTSVFGGPADRESFGETEDFIAARVPQRKFTEQELLRHHQYASLRSLRGSKASAAELILRLKKLIETHSNSFPQDWLFTLEALEIVINLCPDTNFEGELRGKLDSMMSKDKQNAQIIRDGLALAERLTI